MRTGSAIHRHHTRPRFSQAQGAGGAILDEAAEGGIGAIQASIHARSRARVGVVQRSCAAHGSDVLVGAVRGERASRLELHCREPRSRGNHPRLERAGLDDGGSEVGRISPGTKDRGPQAVLSQAVASRNLTARSEGRADISHGPGLGRAQGDGRSDGDRSRSTSLNVDTVGGDGRRQRQRTGNAGEGIGGSRQGDGRDRWRAGGIIEHQSARDDGPVDGHRLRGTCDAGSIEDDLIGRTGKTPDNARSSQVGSEVATAGVEAEPIRIHAALPVDITRHVADGQGHGGGGRGQREGIPLPCQGIEREGHRLGTGIQTGGGSDQVIGSGTEITDRKKLETQVARQGGGGVDRELIRVRDGPELHPQGDACADAKAGKRQGPSRSIEKIERARIDRQPADKGQDGSGEVQRACAYLGQVAVAQDAAAEGDRVIATDAAAGAQRDGSGERGRRRAAVVKRGDRR